MIATEPSAASGECMATYEAVLAYLLANYDVCPGTAERIMKRPWALALHGKGLVEGWRAWEVGDKIAWPMKWAYRGEL